MGAFKTCDYQIQSFFTCIGVFVALKGLIQEFEIGVSIFSSFESRQFQSISAGFLDCGARSPRHSLRPQTTIFQTQQQIHRPILIGCDLHFNNLTHVIYQALGLSRKLLCCSYKQLVIFGDYVPLKTMNMTTSPKKQLLLQNRLGHLHYH